MQVVAKWEDEHVLTHVFRFLCFPPGLPPPRASSRYVYPILAFLAGTLPDGGSPPWIVQGTYMGERAPSPPLADKVPHLAGVVRSNLANEEFIQWLPETMLQFAEHTGAGGFSFDLTYWEEQLPVASDYAQWAGWRSILSQLHTKRGGRGCAGSRCVVDNRQANHAWG